MSLQGLNLRNLLKKTDRKKKVRPVGGGTVGPEPKKKSRDNLTPADKDSLSKARKGGYMPTKGKSLESGVSTTKKTTKTTPKSTTSEPAFTAAEFRSGIVVQEVLPIRKLPKHYVRN